jgi:hypothetical protein
VLKRVQACLVIFIGETPKRKGLITKAGNGKFVTVVKGPNGIVEEWTYTFSDYGVVGVKCNLESAQSHIDLRYSHGPVFEAF